METVIAEERLPWIVKRLGCRVEYWFRPAPPRNGGEAAAAVDPELERYMHLAALNRGILLTPFHNMALLAPAVTEADVDRHTDVFRESVRAGGSTADGALSPARTDDRALSLDRDAARRVRPGGRHSAGSDGRGHRRRRATPVSPPPARSRGAASDVTVLERHTIGWGASSRNGGFVLPGFKPDIEVLARKLGVAEARRLFELSMQAVGGLEALVAEEAIDCDYARCGTVVLAARPGHLVGLERSRRFLRDQLGHETTLLTRGGAARRDRLDAIPRRTARPASPARCSRRVLVQGLARGGGTGGRPAGGRRSRSAGSSGGARDGPWRPRAGAILAREVLVATNGYTGPAVPALQRRVVPVGSYLIATRRSIRRSRPGSFRACAC